MIKNKEDLPECKNCAIRKSALFGEIETIHLDKARALRSEQQIYSPDEYLYREGDVSVKAFTVYKGWVILFKNLDDGQRQIIRFALPGDFLCFNVGKQSVLDHSAIAATDVTLCAFPIKRFRTVIAELPELAFAISSITESAAQRCHSSLTTIASYSAEAKVAFLLLSLYIRERAIDRTDDCVPFPITQEDVSDALGLTSVHVNRVFQNLRKKGLIECKNHCLWVSDKVALSKVAKIDLCELERIMIGI